MKNKKIKKVVKDIDYNDREEVRDKYLSELREELFHVIWWPPKIKTDEQMVFDLIDEVGDLARTVSDKDEDMYRYELLCVAGRALSLLWRYDRRKHEK